MNLEHEIFEGTPEEKWLEVIFHASAHLASAELLYLLERLALMESLLTEYDPLWESKLETHKNALGAQLLQKTRSLALESTGRILSNSE